MTGHRRQPRVDVVRRLGEVDRNIKKLQTKEQLVNSDDRQTFTVDEAARMLGLGRNSAYDAVKRGDIPAIRIGRRLLVPRVALERMLAGESDRPADA